MIMFRLFNFKVELMCEVFCVLRYSWIWFCIVW